MNCAVYLKQKLPDYMVPSSFVIPRQVAVDPERRRSIEKPYRPMTRNGRIWEAPSSLRARRARNYLPESGVNCWG